MHRTITITIVPERTAAPQASGRCRTETPFCDRREWSECGLLVGARPA